MITFVIHTYMSFVTNETGSIATQGKMCFLGYQCAGNTYEKTVSGKNVTVEVRTELCRHAMRK
jgi:hypothetical protein